MNKNESIIAIAEQILKKEGKSLDVYNLFNEVAKVKEYTEEEKEANLSLFHTYLTTDGRFVILHDGSWSLREDHPYEMVNAISTDFDLFDDEEITEDDEEEEYEALDVLVVSDEEELENESKNLKNLIGYEESEEI